LALAVPLSRFASQVGGGSAFCVRGQVKSSIPSVCFLISCLFAANDTRASTDLVSTNLVDRLLLKARFQGDPSRAKAYLQEALDSATLIVRGFVVDSDTIVKASTKQNPDRWSFTNGEHCVFFMKPDKRLSRWCQTNVLEKIEVVPTK
jgi:hypothetical protein